MQQFYHLSAPDTEYKPINFKQPIRKCMIVANRGALIRIASTGVPFYISGGQVFYFDLQSANTGKGVSSLECKCGSSGNTADIYFSVIEYGSSGDNKFFYE